MAEIGSPMGDLYKLQVHPSKNLLSEGSLAILSLTFYQQLQIQFHLLCLVTLCLVSMWEVEALDLDHPSQRYAFIFARCSHLSLSVNN